MFIRSLFLGALVAAAVNAAPYHPPFLKTFDGALFAPSLDDIYRPLEPWNPLSDPSLIPGEIPPYQQTRLRSFASPWTVNQRDTVAFWPYPVNYEPSLIPGEIPPYHQIQQKFVAFGSYPLAEEPSLIPGEVDPYHQNKQNAVALGPYPLSPENTQGQEKSTLPLPLERQDPFAKEPSLIPGEVDPYNQNKQKAVALGPYPLDDPLAKEPSLIPGEVAPYHQDKAAAQAPSFVSDFSTGQDPMEPKPDPTFPEIEDPDLGPTFS